MGYRFAMIIEFMTKMARIMKKVTMEEVKVCGCVCVCACEATVLNLKRVNQSGRGMYTAYIRVTFD